MAKKHKTKKMLLGRVHLIKERKNLTQRIHMAKHIKLGFLGSAGFIATEFIKNLVSANEVPTDKVLLVFLLIAFLVSITLVLVYCEGLLLAEKEEVNEKLEEARNKP